MKKIPSIFVIGIIVITAIIIGGILVIQNNKRKCDYSNLDRHYISKDPKICAIKSFSCPNSGTNYTKPFSNQCGCGCERVDMADLNNCQQMEAEIDSLTKNARLCQKDSDCEVITGINALPPAGCPGIYIGYQAVNKNYDTSRIKSLVNKYDFECPVCREYKSPEVPTEDMARCENNICEVYFKKTN